VFLAITLIGIPLIPLLSLSTVVASLVGSLGVALFVGQSIDRNTKQTALQQFFIGLAILTVLTLLPFLGGLVVFLINLFGLGVILLWQFVGTASPSGESIETPISCLTLISDRFYLRVPHELSQS
jgi:hypothetical protein